MGALFTGSHKGQRVFGRPAKAAPAQTQGAFYLLRFALSRQRPSGPPLPFLFLGPNPQLAVLVVLLGAQVFARAVHDEPHDCRDERQGDAGDDVRVQVRTERFGSMQGMGEQP